MLDGPLTPRSLRADVTWFPAPTLRPGDLVVIDNLGNHEGKAIRRAIRAAGAYLFFLPPYSPGLNPIEPVFAKLKALPRRAAARSVDQTWKTIGTLLDEFTEQECANYFADSGYAPNLRP